VRLLFKPKIMLAIGGSPRRACWAPMRRASAWPVHRFGGTAGGDLSPGLPAALAGEAQEGVEDLICRGLYKLVKRVHRGQRA
jgi:hypothetical protein